jgi:hypothetical protein
VGRALVFVVSPIDQTGERIGKGWIGGLGERPVVWYNLSHAVQKHLQSGSGVFSVSALVSFQQDPGNLGLPRIIQVQR